MCGCGQAAFLQVMWLLFLTRSFLESPSILWPHEFLHTELTLEFCFRMQFLSKWMALVKRAMFGSYVLEGFRASGDPESYWQIWGCSGGRTEGLTQIQVNLLYLVSSRIPKGTERGPVFRQALICSGQSMNWINIEHVTAWVAATCTSWKDHIMGLPQSWACPQGTALGGMERPPAVFYSRIRVWW